MILLTTLMIVAYWDEHRLRLLAGLAVGYGAAGVTAVLVTASKMRNKASPFASTLAELRKDGRQLDGQT